MSENDPLGSTPPPDPVPPPSPQEPNPVDYATPIAGPAPTKDDQTMAMLCHLLGILLGFIGPLIIWLIKKDQSPFVDDQGKEALNFQITLIIGYVIGGATTVICIGFIILPLVWLAGLVFCIMGAMAASKGQAYRYPVTLRLVK
jgi:uncharacterized Tic20 family protein